MGIDLKKDALIALVDDTSGTEKTVTKVVLGAGWDQTGGMEGNRLTRAFRKEAGVDLDLVAVACQGDSPKRYAGGDVLDPLEGAMLHTGDNKTGKGDGDDEQIIVDLSKIQATMPIDTIVFVAGALKPGSDFAKASNIEFNVYNGDGGGQIKFARFWPDLLGVGNAVAIAKVFKHESGAWALEVINEMGNVTQGDFKSVLRFAQGYAAARKEA